MFNIERVQTEEEGDKDDPVDEAELVSDEYTSTTADKPSTTTSIGTGVPRDGLLDIPNGHDRGMSYFMY